ncbi:MAG: glycosyltransferase [Armatimonadota bacterium]|nr:glycosyltransferase [Armatimonadota bacterium]
MRVSVVIPARNAAGTLPACLEALVRQVRSADEVVLVDNGSADATADVARSFRDRLPGLRVVCEPRPGEAVARNRGVAEATGDVIAFTDADCVPHEEWLARALEALEEDPPCHAVAGEVTGYRPVRLVEKYLTVCAFPASGHGQVVCGLRFPPSTFYTANLCVRREVLERVGPFDEGLRGGVDVALCVRLLRAGFRIRYEPRVVVAHVQRDSLRKAARRLFEYGTGLPGWFRKHGEPGLWVTLPGDRSVRLRWFRRPGWVNLATPDRVLAALLAVSVLEPWAAALLGAYAVRLAWRLRSLARRRHVPLATWELAAVTALHVAELPLFTAGTVVGSLRHRVLCVV